MNGRPDGPPADFDLVVAFEGRAKRQKHRAGGLFRQGLDAQHLEPALKGGVACDEPAVFFERRGADAPEVAPGQRRFQEVGHVNRVVVRGARAHDQVNLVDEQDYVLELCEFLEHVVQTLFKRPAIGFRPAALDVKFENPVSEQNVVELSLRSRWPNRPAWFCPRPAPDGMVVLGFRQNRSRSNSSCSRPMTVPSRPPGSAVKSRVSAASSPETRSTESTRPEAAARGVNLTGPCARRRPVVRRRAA